MSIVYFFMYSWSYEYESPQDVLGSGGCKCKRGAGSEGLWEVSEHRMIKTSIWWFEAQSDWPSGIAGQILVGCRIGGPANHQKTH